MASRKGRRFGEWLDTTLTNRDLSGSALAAQVGVHDSAVSRWRSGQGVPSIETCTKIAEALGFDPLQVAVTAGQVPANVAHVEPLPVPPPTARRENVKRQLRRVRGLTERDRRKLLQTYEEIIAEGEGTGNGDGS